MKAVVSMAKNFKVLDSLSSMNEGTLGKEFVNSMSGMVCICPQDHRLIQGGPVCHDMNHVIADSNRQIEICLGALSWAWMILMPTGWRH